MKTSFADTDYARKVAMMQQQSLKEKINYTRKTIIEAAHLKLELETLNITDEKFTIFSLDIEAFYPSTKFKVVERAVKYFAKDLSTDQNKTIDECLKMIKFGMGNTLITYRDKYYEYDGDQEISNKCLTIGGYESAWLADLVAAFILEETKNEFTETKYYGIYRDDGLVILNGKKSKAEIENWLQTFQQKVNETLQDNGLIFTCCLWDRNFKGNKKETTGKKVSVDDNDYFPYLDMKFLWDQNNKLKFEVYLKPGQRLKYLNKGSTHQRSCFEAITTGVYGRLGRLTTKTEENKNMTLDEMYPGHFKALKDADLIYGTIPKLKDVYESPIDKTTRLAEREERKKQRSRASFFCVGYSNAWGKKAIHTRIGEIHHNF